MGLAPHTKILVSQGGNSSEYVSPVHEDETKLRELGSAKDTWIVRTINR